jgi:transposase
MKKENRIPIFKPYIMGQPSLLPPDLDEMIPEKHVVRVVNEAIEGLDLEVLYQRYKGGGTSSFHPKMMLKVLVYSYTQGVYSSRKIAKGLRENINYMWLSGRNRPDFRTINRFRGEVMKGIIQEIFAEVLMVLVDAGYINLENYFVDGTIVEANARKHSAVWRKNTERYQKQLKKSVEELLEEIERENEAENERYGDKDLEEMGEDAKIDSEKLKKKIEELNERLKKNPKDKKTAKAVKKLEKNYLPRQEKYEQQERLLGERNSYSKTDPDATFMRMKEDRSLDKAWPKAAYNIQMGTENQFIVGFSIHQRPGDTSCFKPHLEQVRTNLSRLPQKVIGDAGYGSEENYIYLAENQLENYLKYNTFHQEQTKKYQADRFKAENLPYDEAHNRFHCPNGQFLAYQETRPYTTENGYHGEYAIYECQDCSQCQFKSDCFHAQGNRQIKVNWNLRRLKAQAKENLNSETGRELRSQRGEDVEAVFGHIKQNRQFRRFLLRGLEKVTTEWGLLSIASNMLKLAAVS